MVWILFKGLQLINVIVSPVYSKPGGRNKQTRLPIEKHLLALLENTLYLRVVLDNDHPPVLYYV